MPSQGGSQPHLDYVVDAVEALRPHQREVIEALFYERISAATLAKRRSVHRSTVTRTRDRALANLERGLRDAA
jgi:DNA-directed RNA polymerase specialized sigma24 family protein